MGRSQWPRSLRFVRTWSDRTLELWFESRSKHECTSACSVSCAVLCMYRLCYDICPVQEALPESVKRFILYEANSSKQNYVILIEKLEFCSIWGCNVEVTVLVFPEVMFRSNWSFVTCEISVQHKEVHQCTINFNQNLFSCSARGTAQANVNIKWKLA